VRRPALRYRLPGTWAQLDLSSAEASDAAVARLVAAEFGRRDQDAQLRRTQRESLSRAVAEARNGGATQMHLSLRTGPSTALATLLTEYRRTVPAAQPDPEALLASIAAAVTGATADDAWNGWADAGGSLYKRGESLVARRSRIDEHPPSGAGAEPTHSLTVDYWSSVPGRSEVVLTTFTTGLAELGPLLGELFDAIMSTAEWADAAS
jgi:hypothetical protein